MATGDMFEEMFGGIPRPRGPKAQPETQEKGVQLRGREIGGTYYIRADDVVGLLEVNKVLPKIAARIKARVKQTGGSTS